MIIRGRYGMEFLNTKDKEGQDECLKLLGQYEGLLNRISTDIIKSLHSLKHFYATVSICATSGWCDSFVACEAFYREVGTFVANWQGYFELWSAREKKGGYDRLHDFLEHCSSNQEFMRYNSTGSISKTLYAQQLINYCWETTGKDHGLCWVLRGSRQEEDGEADIVGP